LLLLLLLQLLLLTPPSPPQDGNRLTEQHRADSEQSKRQLHLQNQESDDKIAALQRAVTAANQHIREQKAEVENGGGTIAQLRQQLQQRQTEMAQLQKVFEAVTADAADLKIVTREVMQRESSATEMSQRVGEVSQQLLSRVTALQQEKQQLKQKQQQLQQQVKQSQSEIATLTTERETLTGDNHKLQSALSAEERERSELLDRHAALQATADTDSARLAQYDRDASTVSELQQQCQKLQDSLRVKDVVLADHQSQIATLKTRVTELSLQSDSSAQEYAEKEDQMVGQLDDLVQREKQVIKERDNLQEELASVRVEYDVKAVDTGKRELRRRQEEVVALRTELKKQSDMMAYVQREVSEMKGLFADKERQLRQEHAATITAAAEEHSVLVKELSSSLSTCQHDVATLTTGNAALTEQLQSTSQQNQDLSSALQQQQQKVHAVEEEMRSLLHEMQQRKQAALLFAQQLAAN
jgi:chromosome segregation ATPase